MIAVFITEMVILFKHVIIIIIIIIIITVASFPLLASRSTLIFESIHFFYVISSPGALEKKSPVG